MTIKKLAAEKEPFTEKGRGSLKASDKSATNDPGCARLRTSSPRAKLPPIEDVDWEGGDSSSTADITTAPEIKSRTIALAPSEVLLSGKSKGRARSAPPPIDGTHVQGRLVDIEDRTASDLDQTCQKLRELQRRKVAALKARIAIDNQITALVAIELGYSAGLEEADRKALWTEAKSVIKHIGTGGGEHANEIQLAVPVVQATLQSSEAFDRYLGIIEREMEKLAKTLPVYAWVKEQRGLGALSLAAIVGECGNIGTYSGPAALQSRMGMAPIQHNGTTKMPSSWRSGGGLPAEVWAEAGYSPRRRSIMYVIGECLVKLNQEGEFRKRYDEAKAKAKERHEDWTDGHCHNHAMLLASKLVIKRLWQRWRGQLVDMPPRLDASKNAGFAAGKAVFGPPKIETSPSRIQKRSRSTPPQSHPETAGVPKMVGLKKSAMAPKNKTADVQPSTGSTRGGRAKPIPPASKTLTAASRTQRTVVVAPRKALSSKAVRVGMSHRTKLSTAKIK
jgi:hypothetical protein